MNREIRKKIKAGFIQNNNLEWFSKARIIQNRQKKKFLTKFF